MGNGGRPAELPPAHVTVYLDDQLVGEATVGEPFQPYQFTIPPEVAQRAAVKGRPGRLEADLQYVEPEQVVRRARHA